MILLTRLLAFAVSTSLLVSPIQSNRQEQKFYRDLLKKGIAEIGANLPDAKKFVFHAAEGTEGITFVAQEETEHSMPHWLIKASFNAPKSEDSTVAIGVAPKKRGKSENARAWTVAALELVNRGYKVLPAICTISEIAGGIGVVFTELPMVAGGFVRVLVSYKYKVLDVEGGE